MAYLSKHFALERGGGDYKLDKSNLIAPALATAPAAAGFFPRVGDPKLF